MAIDPASEPGGPRGAGVVELAPVPPRGDGRGRRQPVQQRSRRTVQRILRAAEAIVAEEGVDAATTRTIAHRARVAVPSLYRFFDDRDAILDALLEEALAELEVVVQEAERGFSGESIEAFIRLELELYVAYYEEHPSLARLWFGGRVSPAVVELVRERNHEAAQRARRVLTQARLVDEKTPELVFDLLIEYGDRTLDLALRGGGGARRDVIETGLTAMTAFVESYSRRHAAAAPKRKGRPQPSRRSHG